jgi:hypothetical protein
MADPFNMAPTLPDSPRERQRICRRPAKNNRLLKKGGKKKKGVTHSRKTDMACMPRTRRVVKAAKNSKFLLKKAF